MKVLDQTKKYTYHSNTTYGYCDLTILLGDKKDYYDDTFFHEGFLPKDFGDERFRTGERRKTTGSLSGIMDLAKPVGNASSMVSHLWEGHSFARPRGRVLSSSIMRVYSRCKK